MSQRGAFLCYICVSGWIRCPAVEAIRQHRVTWSSEVETESIGRHIGSRSGADIDTEFEVC